MLAYDAAAHDSSTVEYRSGRLQATGGIGFRTKGLYFPRTEPPTDNIFWAHRFRENVPTRSRRDHGTDHRVTKAGCTWTTIPAHTLPRKFRFSPSRGMGEL